MSYNPNSTYTTAAGLPVDVIGVVNNTVVGWITFGDGSQLLASWDEEDLVVLGAIYNSELDLVEAVEEAPLLSAVRYFNVYENKFGKLRPSRERADETAKKGRIGVVEIRAADLNQAREIAEMLAV